MTEALSEVFWEAFWTVHQIMLPPESWAVFLALDDQHLATHLANGGGGLEVFYEKVGILFPQLGEIAAHLFVPFPSFVTAYQGDDEF